MKIAVIGAGMVGGTLGKAWANKGHEIVFGVREPSDPKVKDLLAESPGASADGVKEAVARCPVVVLATPWSTTGAAVTTAGDVRGKIILDCTNPLKPDLSGLNLLPGTSAAELVQQWARGAGVVKIFNTTGANNMSDPVFNGTRATMFYCGDDANAKATAASLATDLGFDPIDAGPLSRAIALEYMAMLWIDLAYEQKMGRDIAFALLRR